MWQGKTIDGYLEAVAEQIKWRRARSVVTQELRQHLEDQRDAFAAEGQEDPEQLAVEEMGDPVAIGAQLDGLHRPRPQWGLLMGTILLALLGTVLQLWLTATWENPNLDLNPLRTEGVFVLGCGALLLGYFLDDARLARHGRIVYGGALVAGVVAAALSPRIHGGAIYARYVTLCYPVVYALWVYTCRKKGWWGLVLAIGGGAPLAWICMRVPHMLGLLLLLVSGFALMLAAAWNDWFGVGKRKGVLLVATCGVLFAAVAWMVLFGFGYGVQRLQVFLYPEQDPMGMGYQACTIRDVLGASRWLGEGTWNSSLPFERMVPGCEADAFLTTIIYQLGWGPFLAIVLLFAGLMAWIGCRCLKHRSQLGKAVILTVLVVLCGQALCSVAWNLGYALCASAFPLVAGNWNTVVNMGLIGLALSVLRGESIACDYGGEDKKWLPRYRLNIHLEKC